MSGPQDRGNRVNISVNRLISQIIPIDPGLSEEDNRQRHGILFEEVREVLEKYGIFVLHGLCTHILTRAP